MDDNTQIEISTREQTRKYCTCPSLF